MATLELVGIKEIAQICGVTSQVVSNWRERRFDFPPPDCVLACGPIWEKQPMIFYLKASDLIKPVVSRRSIWK